MGRFASNKPNFHFKVSKSANKMETTSGGWRRFASRADKYGAHTKFVSHKSILDAAVHEQSVAVSLPHAAPHERRRRHRRHCAQRHAANVRIRRLARNRCKQQLHTADADGKLVDADRHKWRRRLRQHRSTRRLSASIRQRRRRGANKCRNARRSADTCRSAAIGSCRRRHRRLRSSKLAESRLARQHTKLWRHADGAQGDAKKRRRRDVAGALEFVATTAAVAVFCCSQRCCKHDSADCRRHRRRGCSAMIFVEIASSFRFFHRHPAD